MLVLEVGSRQFRATAEEGRAPLTCAALRRILPLRGQLVQARWSGEALWIPLGDRRLGLPPENSVSQPEPGQILLYPGDPSEMEILVPYGPTLFASKFGPLAGNHVATFVDRGADLRHLGEEIWWHGAQEVVIFEVV